MSERTMVRRRLGAAAIAAALLLAGCGNDDAASPVTVPDEPASTSTTSATSTSAAPEEDEDAEIIAEIEAAYMEQWDAYIEILGAPNPSNPLIEQHYTGSAKERLLETISADVAAGYVTERPADPANFVVTVLSVEVVGDGEAELVSCVVDGLVLRQGAGGEIVNDNVVSVEYRTDIVREGGAWKIASATELGRTEGAGGCTD